MYALRPMQFTQIAFLYNRHGFYCFFIRQLSMFVLGKFIEASIASSCYVH